jgi:hypothetical protein
MTERIQRAWRRRSVHRGRVVYAALPVPVWRPDPVEPSALLVRALARTRAGRPGRCQPVEEAALRTVSDGAAVLSVVRG